MAAASPPNAPVLVVGAGPTGLTMALDLTLRGIKCRIIDRLPIPSDKSKALAMHARTLEMFDERGIVQNFLERGHKVHGTTISAKEHVLVHLSFEEIGGPFPFTLVIPQNRTERTLNEELEKRGVFVERGVELTTFAQDLEKVTALLTHQDGRKEEFETSWLVGCDGAHSTTRHTLNLKFDGEAYEEAFATVDCDVEWSKSNEELHGFLAEDGVVFLFPVEGKRYRIVADDAMPKDDDVLTLEHVQNIVDRRCGTGIKLINATWLTWFKISRRGVTSYRENRAFVCGDSAHVHSPALGQGMNTGIQDAMNLSWKLDLVIKGLADLELLDTYHTERYPIGRDVLKNTDAITKLVTFRNPVVQELRNHLMPILAEQEVVQHRACQTLSMLAINYRHSPLVGKYRNAQGFSLNHPLESASAWLDFGHGPAPGERARDGKLTIASTSKEARLFEIFRNLKHNILIFAGLHSTPEDFDSFENWIRVLTEQSRGVIATHLVLCDSSKAARFEPDSLLYDLDGSLHHSYGAAQTCLYVIRPDGYVGFASQPIDLEHLGAWLAKTFNQNQVLETTR